MQRALVKLHLYAGLIPALFLIPIALSGAVMILDRQLDTPSFHASDYEVTPASQRAPLDPIMERVQQAYGQPEHLTLRGRDTGALEFRFEDRETLYVNPYDGAFLGYEQDFRRPFSRFIRTVHTDLLMGTGGQWVVGLSTAGMAVALIAAMVLMGQRLQRAGARILRVRGIKNPLSRYSRLHGTLGLFFTPVLVIMALTGCFLAFEPVEELTAASLGHPRVQDQTPLTATAGDQRASLDAIVTAAGLTDSDANFMRARLNFPENPREALRIQLSAPDGRQTVFVDPYSAEIIQNGHAEAANQRRSLVSTMRSLHYGTFFGIATELLWLLGCLATTALSLTALWTWSEKKRRKMRGSRRPSRAAHAPTKRPIALRTQSSQGEHG